MTSRFDGVSEDAQKRVRTGRTHKIGYWSSDWVAESELLMAKLPTRIELKPMPSSWLNKQAVEHHYMHTAVHDRACPFGWGVKFDGVLTDGFIIFATPHFQRLGGEFGYEGLPDKWQVLMLSRLWLPDELPFNSETVVISKALQLVQKRWLEVHPPLNTDKPYHIVKVISYADTRYHTGTIYKASNFRLSAVVHSKARAKNTRGVGADSTLIRFIYDLPLPRWEYTQPHQLTLDLAV